jgi:membrane protein implicated in regulation of membrane protease activity
MPPELRGPGRASGAGWFGRIVAAVATGAVLVVAVMFSFAVLAVAAVGGATLLVWLWWKMRHVRRAMQGSQSGDFSPDNTGQSGQPTGDVIEGEVLKGEWKDDGQS